MVYHQQLISITGFGLKLDSSGKFSKASQVSGNGLCVGLHWLGSGGFDRDQGNEGRI
jgi:hypothetical protein